MRGQPTRPAVTGRARLSLWLVFFLWGLSIAAESKLTLSPYLDLSYSDNIFWDMTRVGDATISPGLGLDLKAGSCNFFLDADGKVYQTNNYLNSSMVSGGFSLFRVFSPRTSLYIMPDISLIRFQGSLSYLDSTAPGMVIGIKHALSDHVYGRIVLGVRHSNYLNEDSYDRIRLASSLELSAFFKSQTTVRLTLGMNYLIFPHIVTQVPAATFNAAEDVPAGAAANSDPGTRRGKPAPPTPPSPPQPPTPPTPPSPSDPPAPLPETETVPVSTVIDLAIPQPYVVVRIAQGLGFKTGIVAEFMVRKNQALLQGMQAIGASEWTLEQTDEDFFWQGTRFSVAVKTESILGVEVALDLSFSSKQYQGIEALDLDGVPIQPLVFRSDTLAQANLRISRRFGSLGLFVAGSYRENRSNDLYFQYDFFTISGGVDLSI
ncbi:MAG: hypothetical protein MUC72_01035 [Acidobacteria bacterium]|jgi:hypothetical protein|nr:hypothetical protein [Acidobacteriota bacterium]